VHFCGGVRGGWDVCGRVVKVCSSGVEGVVERVVVRERRGFVDLYTGGCRGRGSGCVSGLAVFCCVQH
jgi:hypothetical protein